MLPLVMPISRQQRVLFSVGTNVVLLVLLLFLLSHVTSSLYLDHPRTAYTAWNEQQRHQQHYHSSVPFMRYATSNDGAEFDAANGNADDINSSTTQEEAKYYPIPTFYKAGCENVTYLPPHIQRVLCLSDLHTDHVDNIAWLANRTRRGDISQNDLLVVAGDISHDLNRIEESLALLLKTNATVLFVAGNHEAWLSSKELQHIKRVRKQQQQQQSSVFTKPIIHTPPTRKILSSIEKLERVYHLCHRMGVLTGCTVVGHHHDDRKNDDLATASHLLWIVPLDSWYDGSLAIQECNELIQDFPKWPWVDFLRCSWWPYFPKNTKRNRRLLQKIPDGLVTYFLQQNEKVIQQFQEAISTLEPKQPQQQQYPPTTSTGLMTVSHFLPNQQCLPDWKDVSSTTFDANSWLNHGGGGVSAKFALVAGTKALDEQIRSLQWSLQQQPQQQQHLLTTNNRQNPPPLLRHIHVFGHSHRPKDFECDGIRYIHNPLGKPREREIHMINPHVDFQLLWDTTMGEVKGETLIRYWEEKGGGVEMLRQRMQRSQRRPSRYSLDSKKITTSTTTQNENVTLPQSPQRQPQTQQKTQQTHSNNKR